jgi:hypothetical protein
LRFIRGEDSFSKVYKFEALELIQVILRIGSNAPRLLFSLAGGGLVFRVTLSGEGRRLVAVPGLQMEFRELPKRAARRLILDDE